MATLCPNCDLGSSQSCSFQTEVWTPSRLFGHPAELERNHEAVREDIEQFPARGRRNRPSIAQPRVRDGACEKVPAIVPDRYQVPNAG